MSKKQQPSRSATVNSDNGINLSRLEDLVKEFSEYLSILESFLDNVDSPRHLRVLNQFNLHRLTGKEIFVVADNQKRDRLSCRASKISIN
jgi:hypothetical protein